jgi:hypothetical protein
MVEPDWYCPSGRGLPFISVVLGVQVKPLRRGGKTVDILDLLSRKEFRKKKCGIGFCIP